MHTKILYLLVFLFVKTSFVNAERFEELMPAGKSLPEEKENQTTRLSDTKETKDTGHPFLIVNESMYTDMREKANQSPWKEIKESADSLFSLQYNETWEEVDDKALLIRDIVSAGTLLWILEPDNQEVYLPKIIETLYEFNDVMESRSDPPNDWKSNVPLACTAFNAIIALDILFDDIAVSDRDSLENLYYNFLENQRSTAWRESYYSSLGIYYLYKGDRENIDFHKQKYRKELEDHLTDDGIFNGGTGYSTSRFLKHAREQKYYFMDVLEFTGEDNYYNDSVFKQLHEWLFAHNFNTYGSIYVFGDAKMGTSIKRRLNESAGTWRVNRFSKQAAQNAAWYVQDKFPVGRLLNFLSVDSITEPVRPNTSKIYHDGAAWFVHNPTNQQHVSGVLWNNMSYSAHAHKETNSLHLAAFGEDLVVNSGYNNWGNGVLGFSWNYIYNQAKSCNTVLIDNKNHSTKKGNGLKKGFIVDHTMAYATGEAGPALNNGTHHRTLQMLYPTDNTSAYWVLFDEVNAYNPVDDFQVLLHPRSSDVEEIEANKFYTWNVKRWTDEGVDLSIFLATPPSNVQLVDGVQADKSHSILTKVLKSTYPTGASGSNQALTLVFPSDSNHPLPVITQINQNEYYGAQVTHTNGTMDEVVESGNDLLTEITGGSFRGGFFFQRMLDDSVSFVFGKELIEFHTGEAGYTKGISASQPVDIYLNEKSGRIHTSFNTSVVFTYPGIEGIKLNGEMLTTMEDGTNTVEVSVPSGMQNIEIIASGIPESGDPTHLHQLPNKPKISVYPNPANEKVTIAGLPLHAMVRTITLFDLQGRKHKSFHQDEISQSFGNRHIQLPEMKSGVYLLKIEFSDQENFKSKFLRIVVSR
ncbi:MAG: heparinase II/III family protein [Bacteroidales bacterium]